MLAAMPGTFFHYTPRRGKYFDQPAPHRHRITTYVNTKSEKIAAQGILSNRWGSWASQETLARYMGGSLSNRTADRVIAGSRVLGKWPRVPSQTLRTAPPHVPTGVTRTMNRILYAAMLSESVRPVFAVFC